MLFIHGFRSPFAYVCAAAMLARRSFSCHTRYELIHCHGGEVAPLARAFGGAPVIASYLGSDLLGHRDAVGNVSAPQRWRARFVRQCSRLADRTITVSEELEDCLPSSVKRSNKVIPDGVDRRAFAPASRSEARRKLGWELSAPIVLFAASVTTPTKRFWLAEEACRRASTEIRDLQLRVVDDVAPGDMPNVMNAADCLLLTSASEGSSNVVKEAIACNLPVISTDVGDVRVLLAEVDPSYVRSPDPVQLSGALVDCLKRGERSNGRARSEDFDALDVARRITRIYAEARRTGAVAAWRGRIRTFCERRKQAI